MSTGEMKSCPFCDEQILAVAKKCRHCGEYLDDDLKRSNKKTPDTAERMLLPVGRPISAIAAGYCALFGVIPMCGLPFSIAAIICGFTALGAIKKDSSLSGKGRAWFGIILGGIATAFSLFMVVALIIASANQPRRF